MNIHYEILDTERRALLPTLAKVRAHGFYLAGGTALALQLGHRDSIDFDFFCADPFDTTDLLRALESMLVGHTLTRTQEERNTLGILIDNTVRASFMTYPYPLVSPQIETEHFPLASMEDIGCMKLGAIVGRATYKDYVDLYCILHHIPLETLLAHLSTKLPNLDPMLAQKSLVYFEDLTDEGIQYIGAPILRETIEDGLRIAVKRPNSTLS